MTGLPFMQGVHLSGSLLAATPPLAIFPKSFKIEHPLNSTEAETWGWYALTLVSPLPLLQEPEDVLHTYRYHFLVRESSERYLLLSTHRELVSHLLRLAGQQKFVRSPSVRISDLALHLASVPEDYCLSALHAEVDGYGRFLRKILMYGDDLAEAALFREMLPRLSAYRVHLRSVRKRIDVLNISSRGDVGFTFRGEMSLREVDNCLRYMSTRDFLKWDIHIPYREPHSDEPDV